MNARYHDFKGTSEEKSELAEDLKLLKWCDYLAITFPSESQNAAEKFEKYFNYIRDHVKSDTKKKAFYFLSYGNNEVKSPEQIYDFMKGHFKKLLNPFGWVAIELAAVSFDDQTPETFKLNALRRLSGLEELE